MCVWPLAKSVEMDATVLAVKIVKAIPNEMKLYNKSAKKIKL